MPGHHDCLGCRTGRDAVADYKRIRAWFKIGLHQRDNQRLLDTLENLRDMGNTVLVVEHDEQTIRAADWIVDLGPGAGINGGRIIDEGFRGQGRPMFGTMSFGLFILCVCALAPLLAGPAGLGMIGVAWAVLAAAALLLLVLILIFKGQTGSWVWGWPAPETQP